MNPLQQLINRNKQPKVNAWQQKFEDMKAGKLDPETTAMEAINNMTPTQRRFFKNVLPKFEAFALKNGAGDSNKIKEFIAKVKQLL